jgi:type 1 glutamine amidotransferase/nicotinamidase-related amidase
MSPNSRLLPLLFVATLFPAQAALAAESFGFRLRYQTPVGDSADRFHRIERTQQWDLARTAIIVCDMWDSHHCYRAVGRVKEISPRLNEVVSAARQKSATIIHAPSDCMAAYVDHPARRRAITTPQAANYPEDIADWCHKIPAEDNGKYPIDQSDGGEDDTPEEHAAWIDSLRQDGRNPRAPWLRQVDTIRIDPEHDLISDSGKEIWNVLEDRGIENVILVGVHTNMCVLGRPFGLRRMVQAGKRVALMRDMTDTMYNPAMWPYVSHFSGTDLIIDHIERHVCPTITSDQILGGKPFRFAGDRRPHVAMVINEPEYETERTLPTFANEHLRRDFRVTQVFGDASDPDRFPGIALIAEADLLLLSARRRTPPAEQLDTVRRFVASGKGVVGIRTANHAFHLRSQPATPPAADWPRLDAEVFGGQYENHYGNDLETTIAIEPTAKGHPILASILDATFVSGGSLYKVSPIDPTAKVLMVGSVAGHPSEPVAWTFTRADGGHSFYTSLGAPGDFEQPQFLQLLRNALLWAATTSK